MQKNEPGGMDKRTLIAFALIILVWVIFGQLMPKPERPEPASGTDTAEQSVPAGALDRGTGQANFPRSSSAPITTQQEGGPAAEATFRGGPTPFVSVLPAEERDVVIEGAHFRAVFSTRGAVLRSWTLSDFTDAAGNPVDLVPNAPGALGLTIQGPGGGLDLSRTLFSVEESAGSFESFGAAVGEGPGPTSRVRILRFTAEGSEGAAAGVRIERIYRIDPERYDLQMELKVSGVSNYRRDHQLVVSWERGIPNLETQTKMERGSKAAVAMLAEEYIKDGFGGSGRPGCGCGGGAASHGGERSYDGVLRWAGVKGKYFGAILVPEHEMPATFIASSDPAQGEVGMRLVLPLADDGPSHYRFTAYIGPIDYRILKDLDARLQRDVTRLVELGAKFIAPISKVIFWFLTNVHRVIPNYGVGIILLTIALRLLFHPLNMRALRSQRKMQALKPQLDALNAQYKDNPEMRTKKMMEMHKTHGVNPVGGCLPLLPQMPVFYALWSVLPNAIELRKAPFALWVTDLSAPDTIGHIANVPINILPVLMAATMLWQQKLTPTDPKQAPMMMLMPVMMLFFFYGMPSGLVLYWTVTNVLAIAQQMMMKPVILPPVPDEPQAKEGQATKSKRRGKK